MKAPSLDVRIHRSLAYVVSAMLLLPLLLLLLFAHFPLTSSFLPLLPFVVLHISGVACFMHCDEGDNRPSSILPLLDMAISQHTHTHTHTISIQTLHTSP